jgi:Protein of unknown function (DUF2950)
MKLGGMGTMHEIVDAEHEYVMVPRGGDSLVEYAGKFLSDPRETEWALLADQRG